MARKLRSQVDWHDMPEIPYRASRMFKALGNPKAYALVRLLLAEPVLTVTEMAGKLRRAQPAVSTILRALRDLEIVRFQRDGNEVLYTLKDPKGLRSVMKDAEACARRAAEEAGNAADGEGPPL